MNTEIYDQKRTNSIREKLYEVLPLDTPYSIVFSLTNVCNFQCFFCIQKAKELVPDRVKKVRHMEYATFKKIVDNIMKTGRLKKINLSGTGEPLLNPEVIRIIDYAMVSRVADEVELITNASLLTKEIADGIIRSELDKVKISIEGLSNEEYKDITGVNVDFDKIVSNIEYLYRHKNRTKIRVKIMDSMIGTEEKKDKFYKIFEPICDEITIENIKPIYRQIDYSRIEDSNKKKNFFNEEMLENEICTRPFFNVNIWADGSVGQCSNVLTLNDIYFGNAADDFDSIWNGKKYNEFLLELLEKKNFAKYSVCRGCVEYRCMALPNDILDGHEDELIEKYKKKIDVYNK